MSELVRFLSGDNDVAQKTQMDPQNPTAKFVPLEPGQVLFGLEVVEDGSLLGTIYYDYKDKNGIITRVSMGNGGAGGSGGGGGIIKTLATTDGKHESDEVTATANTIIPLPKKIFANLLSAKTQFNFPKVHDPSNTAYVNEDAAPGQSYLYGNGLHMINPFNTLQDSWIRTIGKSGSAEATLELAMRDNASNEYIYDQIVARHYKADGTIVTDTDGHKREVVILGKEGESQFPGPVTSQRGFVGDVDGNAKSATKAKHDWYDQVIDSTYLSKIVKTTHNGSKFEITSYDGRYTPVGSADAKKDVITIPGATTTLAGLVTTGDQTITGNKTINSSGTLTIMKQGGFIYSGIQEDKATNKNLPIWFSTGTVNGTPNYSTELTYNPSTGTVTAKKFAGPATSATYDAEGGAIHDKYLKRAGGTMTGALKFADNIYNAFGDDVEIGSQNAAGKLNIHGKNGATGIVFVPYSGSTSQTISIDGAGVMTITGTVKTTLKGNADTATKLKTARNFNITDSSAAYSGPNVSFDGTADVTLHMPDTFAGTLKGNSDTATKLKTARTLWGQSFNGTANISGNMTGVGNVTSTKTNTYTLGTSSNLWKAVYATTFYGALSGNADTATKLQTARSFHITDSSATYNGVSATFDGSAAITLHMPDTFVGTLKGNADTATKATQDANGKVISTEYLHRASNSSSTINQMTTAPKYLISMEAFADGGEVKWVGIESVNVGSADKATKLATARTFHITDSSATYNGANASFDGTGDVTLHMPSTFAGTLKGNADSATKLKTARTLWGQSFNGSANVTGAMSSVGNITSLKTNTHDIGSSSNVWKNIYATTFHGALSGNASTASKWQIARNFQVDLALDNPATVKVDGTKDVILPVTGILATKHGGTGNSSHTANRLVWSETATKLSATNNHYVDATHLAVNYTSKPSYNFHVAGTSYLDGNATISAAHALLFTATTGGTTVNTPMALTYGRLQSYGTLAINADTDGSKTEYLILTAGRGMSNSTSDGLTVGYEGVGIKGYDKNYTLYVGGTTYHTQNIFIPNDVAIHQHQGDTSNYTTLIRWLKNKTGWTYNNSGTQTAYKYQPQIGQHNTGGDGFGSVTILPYATNSEPWGKTVGLYITKNLLQLDNCRIPTTGNTTGTVGSTTQPVYVSAGVIKPTSYYLKSSVDAGTANRMAYFSATNVVNDASTIYANNTQLGINTTSMSTPKLIWDLAATQVAETVQLQVSGKSYFTNTVILESNKRAIEFRPGHESYNSYIYYGTSGNEALNFVNKQAVTSFIFWTGDSVNSSNQWYLQEDNSTARTNNPAVQIKSNSVYINKLLPSGTNPSYKLYVNGTSYFSDLVTVYTGQTNKGIKLGNTYLNAINSDLILQNNGAIRFGNTNNWQYNEWAGLKYDHSKKKIAIGLADGTEFTANSAQSGGRITTAGISAFNVGPDIVGTDAHTKGKKGVMIGYDSSNGKIELSGVSPYIDFHHDNTQTDYTGRIISKTELVGSESRYGLLILPRLGVNDINYVFNLSVKGNQGITAAANRTMTLDTANSNKIGTATGDLHIQPVSVGSGSAITNGNVSAITFGCNNVAYAGIYSPASGSYGNHLIFATTGSYANGAYGRMIITAGGLVGIGTMSPIYKLHVTGDIYANGGWLRTSGAAGWYSETYGGGWYMTDANFIRNYNSKAVSINIASNNSWGIGSHRLAAVFKGNDHVSILLSTNTLGYGLCVNNNGNWYWGKRASNSETSTSGDTYLLQGNTTLVRPATDMAIGLGESKKAEFSNAYIRAISARHLDASGVYSGDMHLYIGYGSNSPTQKTLFYYSTGTHGAAATSRTQFAEINSNGLYALTRFGVNGQNTNYNFYVNGTSFLSGNANVCKVYNSNNYNSNGNLTLTQLAAYNNASCGMIHAATDNPRGAAGWVHVWSQAWSHGVTSSWVSQIALNVNDGAGMWYRTTSGNIAGRAWIRVLDTNNYASVLDGRYVNVTGDTMTGLLTVTTGSSHGGIKMGNTYVTSISGDVIFQNNNAIRFGTDSWDYNCWAGLKYDHANKRIYLGLADGSIFTANAAQSGGRILTPGISYFHVGNQTSYYFANNGNIYGHEIYSNAWFRSYNTCGWYNETYGCHVRAHDGNYGSIRVHGNARNGYEGIHIGTGTNGMTIMSTPGSHQGLYTESVGRWIIYHNAANGLVSIGGSSTTSGYVATINGSEYVQGHVRATGEIQSTTPNGFRLSYGSTGVMLRNDGSHFYFLIGGTGAGDNWNGLRPLYFNLSNGYVYCGHRLYGAVWNDYAEFRSAEVMEPGRVVVETKIGIMKLSTKRLQPGGNIISDTYGYAIGETKDAKTPIAVSGRVLVYPYEDRDSYEPGDAVCTGPNGTVSKMTREEIREYPERIVGTVSEIPDYETWGQENAKVNGRIWIKVR